MNMKKNLISCGVTFVAPEHDPPGYRRVNTAAMKLNMERQSHLVDLVQNHLLGNSEENNVMLSLEGLA